MDAAIAPPLATKSEDASAAVLNLLVIISSSPSV